jgi:uncharacterized protein (TIGR00369 family)
MSQQRIELQMIRTLFDEMIPFNQVIGMEIVALDEKRVTIGFNRKPELVGNPIRGILHGGVISTALDQAGGVMAMLSIARDTPIHTPDDFRDVMKNLGTIDLRVDFLRPGRGERFLAHAEILRRGNKIAVTRMEMYNNDDYRIAVGTGTYLVG